MKTSFSHEALNLSREKWAGFSMSFHEIFCFIFGKKLIDLIFFEQNWSNVDRCVQKPNFTMFASEPNQNPSCEIIFFLNEKLNPNGAQDPNFLLTPSINKFALQKEEKKIRLPWSCIMFNSLSSLPPLAPHFFHTKYTYCQALSVLWE